MGYLFMSEMKNLAIIPARSGSKGLPDKNIKLLNNKPLLAYSIEVAQLSGTFDEIHVSTDSDKYAEIATKHGASVPFLRSKETSSDTASSWDAVRETLNRYEHLGKHFSMVTLLQPTTPLRQPEDIRKAYEIFHARNANSVISVCEVDHSPLWCNTLPEDHSLKDFLRPDVITLPRQKLNTYYRINGAIYMIDVNFFMHSDSIYETNSIAYIMDKEKSIDIDDEFDFRLVEAIMRMNGCGL